MPSLLVNDLFASESPASCIPDQRCQRDLMWTASHWLASEVGGNSWEAALTFQPGITHLAPGRLWQTLLLAGWTHKNPVISERVSGCEEGECSVATEEPKPKRWPCMMRGKGPSIQWTWEGGESKFLDLEIILVRHWEPSILRNTRGIGGQWQPAKPTTNIWLSNMSWLTIHPSTPSSRKDSWVRSPQFLCWCLLLV